MLGATVFGRQDHDVIDWLRPTTADVWRTYNIRDVDTIGVELTARRSLPGGAFVQAGYTSLDLRSRRPSISCRNTCSTTRPTA